MKEQILFCTYVENGTTLCSLGAQLATQNSVQSGHTALLGTQLFWGTQHFGHAAHLGHTGDLGQTAHSSGTQLIWAHSIFPGTQLVFRAHSSF